MGAFVTQTEQVSHAITPRMIDCLRQTKPWVRFLSILGFIGVVFMLVAGLVMIAVGAVGARFAREFGGGVGAALLGLLYILMAVLYVFPSVFLFRYASAIARMTLGHPAEAMETALAAQKSFWKFVGVLMMVMLGLYAVILVVVIAVAVVGALAR